MPAGTHLYRAIFCESIGNPTCGKIELVSLETHLTVLARDLSYCCAVIFDGSRGRPAFLTLLRETSAFDSDHDFQREHPRCHHRNPEPIYE